jgi:N-acetylneuraminic acid mutarotase
MTICPTDDDEIVDHLASSAPATHASPAGSDGGGSNGHHVGPIAAGQWVAYTINAPSTGNYVFSATATSPRAGAQFHVSFDGVDLTGTLDVPKTADRLDFNTVASQPFGLSAGNHVMRLNIDRNASDSATAGNFDTLFVTPLRPGVSLSWARAADAPAARFEGVGRVVHGKLYTFGGYTSVVPYAVSNRASVYDPATAKWTDLGVMPIPETHCGVAVDEAQGRIWFLGGRRGAYPGAATSEVWQYDTAANAWTPLAPLPEPLSAGSAELLNGQIHYLGGNRGQDRATDYDLHYVLEPGCLEWHKAAPLPFARDHFSAVALGGKLYIFGGEIGHDAHHRQQTDASVYDPATDSWTTLAGMPIGKSHAESATFVLNGRVIIAGGQIDNFQATANIVEFDPAANAWAMLPPLPRPLEGAIVQPLGDRLFVTGGYIGANSVSTVTSYTSNPFTGPPNATPALVPRLILPLEFGMMISLCGLLAVLTTRRHRKIRGDDHHPIKSTRPVPL